MADMKVLLKNVIRQKGMPLAQINERIETLYMTGGLNADDRSELLELMHEHASPDNELGDLRTLYNALVNKVNQLEERINALENGGDVDGGEENEQPEYQQWVAWDGVNGGYMTGDIVMHNDKLWQSTLATLNVWEPGAPGVDERYWIMLEDEEGISGVVE